MKPNNEIRFSILVPVYNTECFLSECIESALNQTYKNFEIVLVDDGSTDASGSICDQYAAIYEQVSVYHTENGGQIHAREFAARQAKGDFFVFLDADDRLRSNALETIAAAINKYECDCVIFGYEKLTNGGMMAMPRVEIEEVLTSKRDIYRKCLIGNTYNSMCTKAVKAMVCDVVISDTNLLQIRLGEDLIQSLKVFKNSERIAFIKDVLYEYRDNPNSISYTATCDAYRKSICVNEMVYQFLKQEQVFDKQDFDEFRQICMEKHVDELLRICCLKATTSDKVHLIQKLRNADYFCDFVNQGQIKQLPFRRRVLFLLSRWRLDCGIVLLAGIYAKWLDWKGQCDTVK